MLKKSVRQFYCYVLRLRYNFYPQQYFKYLLKRGTAMKEKILWVEGKRADSPSFVPTVRKKDYAVDVVETGSAALARLEEFDPDMVVVNAASMRSSGKRICCDLRAQLQDLPILLLQNSEHPVAENDPCASAILLPPFTQRKLTNRIGQLLPGDGKLLLKAGAIQLDLDKRRVQCQGRETRLTPRLTQLLQIFLKKPGEVHERDKLFREVWQTEYTADTRSLDVHISWLREAIEVDPRKPQFLKTIRGVGYRLDV
jgi:DNA-binding response OmpR family regulator